MSGRRYVTRDADLTGRVGHYGCADRGGSRLVRLAYAGEGRPPRSAVVSCPVCGERHRVVPIWRPSRPRDEGRTAEITVEGGVSE